MRYYLHALDGSSLRVDDLDNDVEAERHATAYARHYGVAVDVRALVSCDVTGHGLSTRRVCGIGPTGIRFVPFGGGR